MCGRFASGRDPEDLAILFGAAPLAVPAPAPSWNIAPTDPVVTVVECTDADRDQPPRRRLQLARWGLVPSWATDLRVGARMINARIETVRAKPAFRGAFCARRCLVPAEGYYEWQPGSGKAKTPHFISRQDGALLAFAGLYELWRRPGQTDRADGPAPDPGEVWTVTIITAPARPGLAHLHDRMPVVLQPVNYAPWLDPRHRDPGSVAELLEPVDVDQLNAYPVSAAVGNVANNGPHLREPLLQPRYPTGASASSAT